MIDLLKYVIENFESSDIWLLIIIIIVSIVILFKIFDFFRFKYDSQTASRAEYEWMKSFLIEKDGLHPYAKEVGLQRLTQKNYHDPQEIEFILAHFEKPVQALRDYKLGYKYFIRFDQLK